MCVYYDSRCVYIYIYIYTIYIYIYIYIYTHMYIMYNISSSCATEQVKAPKMKSASERMIWKRECFMY